MARARRSYAASRIQRAWRSKRRYAGRKRRRTGSAALRSFASPAGGAKASRRFVPWAAAQKRNIFPLSQRKWLPWCQTGLRMTSAFDGTVNPATFIKLNDVRDPQNVAGTEQYSAKWYNFYKGYYRRFTVAKCFVEITLKYSGIANVYAFVGVIDQEGDLPTNDNTNSLNIQELCMWPGVSMAMFPAKPCPTDTTAPLPNTSPYGQYGYNERTRKIRISYDVKKWEQRTMHNKSALCASESASPTYSPLLWLGMGSDVTLAGSESINFDVKTNMYTYISRRNDKAIVALQS